YGQAGRYGPDQCRAGPILARQPSGSVPMNHAKTDLSARWAQTVSGHKTDQTQEVATRKSDAHSRRLEVIPSLDGIRAVSMLIVVLCHSGLEDLVPGGL